MLKPVDDTRMYEKLAVSLAGADSPVVICGYPSKQNVGHPFITTVPSSAFRRLSIARILQPVVLLVRIYRERPALLIVNTHELLVTGIWLRLLTGTRLIYDIRENYYLNIRYLPTFSRVLRTPLALLVRMKELITSPFITWFFLSDACYAHQLRFIGRRFTVLENKVKASLAKPRPRSLQKDLRLLFTGTLAETTGVFDAIDLAMALHREDNRVQLVIAGHCAHGPTYRRLEAAVRNLAFVELIGGCSLLPHEIIMEQIHQADLGVIAYAANPATAGKIPTKLYEYLANTLPIVTTPNTTIESYCRPYAAALVWHKGKNCAQLLADIRSFSFYAGPRPGREVFWQSQSDALHAAVQP